MRPVLLALVAVCSLTGASSLHPAWTLSLRSVGPVRLGSTIAEFRRSAGRELAPGAISRDCGYASTRDEQVSFYTRNGRVTMATVYRGRSVRTRSGIGEGSTLRDLLQAYPGRITDGGEVNDGDGHYFIYVPQDVDDQAYRIVFHVDQGHVLSMSVGMLPDILIDGEASRCYEG